MGFAGRPKKDRERWQAHAQAALDFLQVPRKWAELNEWRSARGLDHDSTQLLLSWLSTPRSIQSDATLVENEDGVWKATPGSTSVWSARIRDDGWLTDESGQVRVSRIPTERARAFTNGGPSGILWDVTGRGTSVAFWAESLCHQITRANNDDPRVWHFLIGRDGTVYQCAPVTHAASPVPKAPDLVTVVLDNAGQLRVDGEHLYCENTRFQKNRAESVSLKEGGVAWWESFTPDQEASATQLVAALRTRHDFTAGQVSFGRAHFEATESPGPLWMRGGLERVVSAVFGS